MIYFEISAFKREREREKDCLRERERKVKLDYHTQTRGRNVLLVYTRKGNRGVEVQEESFVYTR